MDSIGPRESQAESRTEESDGRVGRTGSRTRGRSAFLSPRLSPAAFPRRPGRRRLAHRRPPKDENPCALRRAAAPSASRSSSRPGRRSSSSGVGRRRPSRRAGSARRSRPRRVAMMPLPRARRAPRLRRAHRDSLRSRRRDRPRAAGGAGRADRPPVVYLATVLSLTLAFAGGAARPRAAARGGLTAGWGSSPPRRLIEGALADDAGRARGAPDRATRPGAGRRSC